MKIYTKKGDQGETSLYGGQRVSKSSKRIEAYGTVDELNSILGMANALPATNYTNEAILTVQNHLFVLGADLATPHSKEVRIDRISSSEIEWLEKSIDFMEDALPPLKSFILPGGSQAGSLFHFARTVCRRAERITVECGKEEQISDLAIMYLNRLSDFLFVIARYENHRAQQEETPWTPTK